MGGWMHLLTQTVTYSLETGRTTSGDPVFGAQATAQALVQASSELVVGADGTERRAKHRAVVSELIPEGSKVWLPGDNTGSTEAGRRVIASQSYSAPDGRTLYEVML